MKRQPYFVAKSLEAAKIGKIDYSSYVEENGKKSVLVDYEPSEAAAAVISAAYQSRGLKREAKPATVQPEVKAAEVKEEIVEEKTMSENMVVLTIKEFNAILEAARSSVTVKEIIKTVYPADYEELKVKSEKYDKLVAEMTAAKYVAVEKTADDNESPFNEEFCEDNKAFKKEEVRKEEVRKEEVRKEEVKNEKKREDCLFGDDFVFSTDYITQARTLNRMFDYTGALLDKAKLACAWNRDKQVSFTNGYEFVAAITKLAMTDDRWKEVSTSLIEEREGTNVVSKSVRALLKAYLEEGLSKEEIGEAMSLVE